MNDHASLDQHIRDQLDAQPIDDATRQRLREARRQAVSSLDQPARGFGFMPPVARAGFALAGIAALVGLLMLMLGRQPGVTTPISSPEAFEIATSGQPLEFYQELEFYLWLEQQPDELG